MKRCLRSATVLLSVFLLAVLALCIPSGATAPPDGRDARLEQLFTLYAQYREKEDAAGDTLHRTSEMIWDEYLTPHSKLTGEDAATEEVARLIYQKGAAMASLSWIYYSHKEQAADPRVEQSYREQTVRILSKTTQSSDLVSFFEGNGHTSPKVYDCYTALLDTIYIQRLNSLSLPQDSPEAERLLSEAVARLSDRSAFPSDPTNPTPAFTAPSEEDAASYRRYVSSVSTRLTEQRNRDRLLRELTDVCHALYPEVSFSRLSELAGAHPAVDAFLQELPDTETVLQMNELLERAAQSLVEELASSLSPHTQDYLRNRLQREIADTVALASGAIPTPRVAELASVCFGDTYRWQLATAKGKDRLTAKAAALGGLSPEEQAILSALLREYNGDQGRLALCLTEAEALAETARAECRMDWLAQRPLLQTALRDALSRFAALPDTDPAARALWERLDAQYRHTDLAIRDGHRDTDPSLSQDLTQTAEILRDGEILSFYTRHPLVAAPPATVDRSHRLPLAAALSDAERLSDAAAREGALRPRLIALGEHYKLATQAEIQGLLAAGAGGTDPLDKLNDLLRVGAQALYRALSPLSPSDPDGTLSLASLRASADALTRRAERIHSLLHFYETAVLSETPLRYADRMHTLCEETVNALCTADEARLDPVESDAVAGLTRLLSLERICRLLHEHPSIDQTPSLLSEAERALLPHATQPPADPVAYEALILSRLHDGLRSAALADLERAYTALLLREDAYSPSNLAALKSLYLAAAEEAKTHPLSLSAEDSKLLMRRVEEARSAMNAIRLDRLTTAPSSPYAGTAEAPDGFTVETLLTVSPADVSSKMIAEQIRLAAREDRVHTSGQAAPKALRRLLKRCSVIAALNVQWENLPKESRDYRLSVSLPEGTDPSSLCGAVYLREDGSVEFYDLSADDAWATFTVPHFSSFYLIGEGVIRLTPWILLLALLILAEIAVLLLLYTRKKRRAPQPPVALSLLPLPLLLRVSYVPRGGLVWIALLGVVAIGLGVRIALLLRQERQGAEEREPMEEPLPARLPVSVSVACPEPPTEPIPLPPAARHAALSQVTAEDAELLMTDEEAMESRQSGEADEERYRGSQRAQINLDTIAAHFSEGETVHLNALKERGLLPKNVGFVKILARGTLDKPLTVLAQDFSTAALKMILLTGGTPIVTHASPEREKRAKPN